MSSQACSSPSRLTSRISSAPTRTETISPGGTSPRAATLTNSSAIVVLLALCGFSLRLGFGFGIWFQFRYPVPIRDWDPIRMSSTARAAAAAGAGAPSSDCGGNYTPFCQLAPAREQRRHPDRPPSLRPFCRHSGASRNLSFAPRRFAGPTTPKETPPTATAQQGTVRPVGTPAAKSFPKGRRTKQGYAPPPLCYNGGSGKIQDGTERIELTAAGPGRGRIG